MQYIQSIQTVVWKLTLRATEMLSKYYSMMVMISTPVQDWSFSI